MARKDISFADDLISLPWWVSTIMAGVSFGVFYFVVPALWGTIRVNGISANVFLKGLAQAGSFIAIFFFLLLFFLAMATLSLYKSFLKGNKRILLFNSQKSMETLRSLSWQDFERLVGEAYRRKGYTITETGGGGADGGIDLVLKKNGETIFVQCKHWKMDRVGVIIIRELLGFVYDKKASGGIVITSGTFTQEAIDFARGNPIQLVNGKELLAMISVIKNKAIPIHKGKPTIIKMPVHENPTPLLCPLCGSTMVLRTAKKGPTAGSLFYGCSKYPKCKGTRQHES